MVKQPVALDKRNHDLAEPLLGDNDSRGALVLGGRIQDKLVFVVTAMVGVAAQHRAAGLLGRKEHVVLLGAPRGLHDNGGIPDLGIMGYRLAAVEGRLAENADDARLTLESLLVAELQVAGAGGRKQQARKGGQEPK